MHASLGTAAINKLNRWAMDNVLGEDVCNNNI